MPLQLTPASVVPLVPLVVPLLPLVVPVPVPLVVPLVPETVPVVPLVLLLQAEASATAATNAPNFAVRIIEPFSFVFDGPTPPQ